MPRVLHAYVFATLAAILATLGCGRPAADPAVVKEHRTRLELPDEPDGAQTVLEVRQVMYGIDPAGEHHLSGAEDHDHDGDGVQDHAPEDHVDAEAAGEPASAGGEAADADHADHAHDEDADHDHEGEDHAHDHGDHEHDHAADAGDDAEEPAPSEPASAGGEAEDADHTDHAHEEHADHEGEDHEHAEDHAHEEEDHDAHAHEDHDHDGDGVQDHTPEEHDAGEHRLSGAGAFEGDPVHSEMDVVMVGSVGGVPNPTDQSHPDFPFAEGKAVFFLADPEAVAEMEEHEHKHAPGEECAFCEAHAAESAHLIAVVQFADENGKPLNIDARDLFDLKEKETVVVKGKAKIAPGGMLTVDATGLYVRR
jgi:hypothetical protein